MSGVRASQPVRSKGVRAEKLIKVSITLNRKNMAGLIEYVQESYNELRNHVSWTPLPEAQRLMVVVAVFSVLFALAVWGVDTVFSEVITLYFKKIVGAGS